MFFCSGKFSLFGEKIGLGVLLVFLAGNCRNTPTFSSGQGKDREKGSILLLGVARTSVSLRRRWEVSTRYRF